MSSMVTAEDVKRWIDDNKSRNDITECLFSVLVLDKDYKNAVESLLQRNGFTTDTVDTIPGCWNLNENWYEFATKAAITWGGAYPSEWNIDDVMLLRALYFDRKIYINVHTRNSKGVWEPMT